MCFDVLIMFFFSDDRICVLRFVQQKYWQLQTEVYGFNGKEEQGCNGHGNFSTGL